MAQVVERRLGKAEVTGPSPVISSKKHTLRGVFSRWNNALLITAPNLHSIWVHFFVYVFICKFLAGMTFFIAAPT